MSSPSGPEESERRDDDDVERADARDRLDEIEPSEMPDDATVAEPGDDPDEQQWRFAVEPESVSLENALFVVVGVLLTVGILLLAVL